MAGDNEQSDSTTLSAEEAFARLGDETRLDVLQTLGTADEPLSFSELRDRVGYETAGNFSYHLDQLTAISSGRRRRGTHSARQDGGSSKQCCPGRSPTPERWRRPESTGPVRTVAHPSR